MFRNSTGFIMIISALIAVISAFSSSRQKKKSGTGKAASQQFHQKGGYYQGGNFTGQKANPSPIPQNYYREEWNEQKIREQSLQFENPVMDESHYQEEEKFRRRSNFFRPEVVKEEVIEYVPAEYVPSEFGENNQADDFYSQTSIQNALMDEEDKARQNAYRIKAKGFEAEAKIAKETTGRSLKKAIIWKEILSSPKGLKAENNYRD